MFGGNKHTIRPAVLAALTGLSLALTACSGSSGQKSGSDVVVGTPAPDLPADVVTPPGTTVPAGQWGVIEAHELTADIDGVKKGTRTHLAVKVTKVTKAAPGSIKSKDVQQLGTGDKLDIDAMTPFHIEFVSAPLSGWMLESQTNVRADGDEISGSGELVGLDIRSTKIEACPGIPANAQVTNEFGVPAHHCEVVLGSDSAAPTRLVHDDLTSSGETTKVYFELPAPVGKS